MSKKSISIILALLLSLGLAGCSAQDTASESPSPEEAPSAAPEGTEAPQDAALSCTVQVESIEDNSLTGLIGSLAMPMAQGGDTDPERGQGADAAAMNGSETPPEGQAPTETDETPPEPPEGQSPAETGETPPEPPEGQALAAGGGTPPAMSLPFTASGESIRFFLTEETVILAESGESAGAEDILVGSVLELRLNGENEALEVLIRSTAMDGGPGGGFGGSGTVSSGTSANTIQSDGEIIGESYSSAGDNENALRVDGASVDLTDITVDKSGGSSSNTEDGDFYGQNAALLALNGATVNITGAEISSSAVNGNGVFSYGQDTTVNISDSVIRTAQRNSGGIQTTGGGTTNACNLDIETQGASSAAIRSDRGGGTVNVEGGSYVTNGTGSPAVYSTAQISVSGAVLRANNSEAIVIEGKNSVSLKDCIVSGSMAGTYGESNGENIHAVMIYQSMSGDAALGESSFTAEGGSITALTGDMFYVTNTSCTISLKAVEFTMANDIFLRIEGNDGSRGWGMAGANGGQCILRAAAQAISGSILTDDISSLDMTLSDGSSFTGAVNPQGQGGQVSLTLEAGSTWKLTADSYLSAFSGSSSDLDLNGFTLYVNGEAYEA